MPEMFVIHMEGAGTGGNENGIANVDIPEDGTIVGIEWATNADLDADGEFVVPELSFISTSQGGTNDARGIISQIAGRMSLTTSGVAMVSLNGYTPMDLAVAGGERLYLHVSASSGVTSTLRCNIHFQPVAQGGLRRRSARRR